MIYGHSIDWYIILKGIYEFLTPEMKKQTNIYTGRNFLNYQLS